MKLRTLIIAVKAVRVAALMYGLSTHLANDSSCEAAIFGNGTALICEGRIVSCRLDDGRICP